MRLITKKIILHVIDSTKKVFFLDKLSKKNLQGFNSAFSKLRFLKHTKVKVPFSLGRTIRGVSFKNKNFTLDPYAKLCQDISNGVDDQIILINLLSEFNKEKDLSVADIFSFSGNTYLKKYPAWAIVMPWEEISIEDMFRNYPKNFYQNRKLKGLLFESRSRKSILQMMYSSTYAENRLNQMKKLYASIKRFGIKEKIELPKIKILVKDNEWRWVMGDGGNHRSYILSCLNNEFFEARVTKIIKKSDINNWYNVKNKTYSVTEAEHIFESYFDGSSVLRSLV